MKASGKIKDKAEFSFEQEKQIRGKLSPGECKFFTVSRITGTYLVIIKMDEKGEITVMDRKIGSAKDG